MVNIDTFVQWFDIFGIISTVVMFVSFIVAVAQLVRSPKPLHYRVTPERFYGCNWFGRFFPILIMPIGIDAFLMGLQEPSTTKLILSGIGLICLMIMLWGAFFFRWSARQTGLRSDFGWPFPYTRRYVQIPWQDVRGLQHYGLGPIHVCSVTTAPNQSQTQAGILAIPSFMWKNYCEFLQLIVDHAPPTMTVDRELVSAIPQLDLATAGQHFQRHCT